MTHTPRPFKALLAAAIFLASACGLSRAATPTIDQLAAELAGVKARVAVVESRVGVADFAGPAPYGVHLVDEDASPETLRGRIAAWNFGDPSSSRNAVNGPAAAHVYDKPGRYTITRAVAGTVRTWSVIVRDDNRTTAYLSPVSGDDAGDGTAAKPVRSLSRAAKLARQQILIEAGASVDVTDTIRLGNLGRLSTYGGAANAKLVMPFGKGIGDFVATGGEQVLVERMTFTTSSAPANDQANMPTGVSLGGKAVTIRDCAFDGVGYAIKGGAAGCLVLGNVAPRFDSIRAYFLFAGGDGLTILGNRVPNSTREHVIRLFADRVNVQDNALANVDRTAAGDKDDTAKPPLTLQQGSIAYVAGNLLTGGPVVDGPLASEANRADRMRGVVFERNRTSGIELKPGADAVTIRGNLTVDPYGDNCVNVFAYDNAYGRGVADVVIEGNTGWESGTAGTFARVGAGARGVSITNNLYVAPKLILGPYDASAVLIGADLAQVTLAGNVWSAGTPGAAKQAGKLPMFVGGYLDVATFARLAPTDKVQAIAAGTYQVGTAGVDPASLPAGAR